MRVKSLILGVMVFVISLWGARAEAFVFINEFLADPAPGLAGDANNDGVRHSYDDEFIELFNLSPVAVNIGGWYITDSVTSVTMRHIFREGSSIGANSAFVVFGGGVESLMPDHWQVASEGTLNLNNSGDTITLYDVNNQVVDQVTYHSEAGDDQSLVRNPEGSIGAWIKHAALPNANGKFFSPGHLVNTPIPQEQNIVPEPATICYLALGLGSIIFRRRRSLTILHG